MPEAEVTSSLLRRRRHICAPVNAVPQQADAAPLYARQRTDAERTVTIEGHTDNVGSESANFDLSQRRADSVKSHLQSQGIAASRLLASGKGEGSPVAGNDSAAGRQLNRRVEIIISNNLTSAR